LGLGLFLGELGLDAFGEAWFGRSPWAGLSRAAGRGGISPGLALGGVARAWPLASLSRAWPFASLSRAWRLGGLWLGANFRRVKRKVGPRFAVTAWGGLIGERMVEGFPLAWPWAGLFRGLAVGQLGSRLGLLPVWAGLGFARHGPWLGFCLAQRGLCLGRVLPWASLALALPFSQFGSWLGQGRVWAWLWEGMARGLALGEHGLGLALGGLASVRHSDNFALGEHGPWRF
jgi:hypothetical protein